MAKVFPSPKYTKEEFEELKETSYKNWLIRFEELGMDTNSEYCQRILTGVKNMTLDYFLSQRLANTLALLCKDPKVLDN